MAKLPNAIGAFFDVFLSGADGKSVEPEAAIEALRPDRLRTVEGDPYRFWYRNPDTSVFFQVLLAAPGEAEAEAGAEGDAAEAGEPDAADDADESEAIALAPVTISVPFLTPSFFAREALELAQSAAARLGLSLSSSVDEAAADAHAAANAESIVKGFEESNREAFRAVGSAEKGSVTFWSRAKAEAWWAYGSHRSATSAELGPDVHVPVLLAARHEDSVKTLARWDAGTPVALPRSDLLLVRRQRMKKGLLLSKRVTEEGLVPCSEIWDLLAPYSELRKEPVEMLVFREAAPPPQEVAARLEVIALEPVARARRQELTGVVDFEASDGR